MTIKTISFNGRSLLNYDKFRRILRILRQHHPDIILLQDIAPSQANFNPSYTRTLWQNLWQGRIYISKHTAILISPQFSSSLISISSDTWVMDVSITHPKLSNIVICNIYAPARSELQPSFWSSLPPLYPNTMIIGGDFNVIMHPSDHLTSSITHSHRPQPEILHRIFPSFIDLAATPHPKFTCFTNTINSWSKSRIDYILLHPKIIHPNHRTYTLLLPNDSDHRAVISTFTKHKRSQTWRLNASLLQNPTHHQIILNILAIHSHIQSPYQWDDCKDKIQAYLKTVGRSAARCRTKGIQNLTNRLCKLQNSPFPSSPKISAIQAKIKSLQTIQANSIAIRSTTRWMEQGEQSTR